MNIKNILNKATDFGSFRSRDNFFSFSIKTLIYIFPAIVLGHLTDNIVKIMLKNKVLSDTLFFYIFLQTMIIITTLYLFIIFFKNFIIEFQTSNSGSFFVVLYFGMQQNYIYMLNNYMNSIIKL
jgi:hypothetical protein